MQRRSFLKAVGAAMPATAMGSSRREPQIEGEELPWGDWFKIVDRQVEDLLQKQDRKQGHRNLGGFPNAHGLFHASAASNHVSQLVTAYVSDKSTYFRSKEVERSLVDAATFLNSVQHDDGTIDLLTTNFHSPPDTGFAVEPLAIAVGNLATHLPNELSDFHELAKSFLTKAGAAMATGGIHTPNHRWVVCMALARIHTLFPEESYLARIDQWLGEGIDIDPDGQYTEKSTAIYSPLVNRCLITIARLLDKTELLNAVRRNLDMTRYMVRRNGEIVTEASRRQDQFRISTTENYFYSYRYMAIHDQSGDYAGMANMILRTGTAQRLARNLAYFLDDEKLGGDVPEPTAPPSQYRKHFSHSQLLRIRREQIDISVIGNNFSFLTFFKGNAALQAVRLASAFFGKGQFAGEMTTDHGTVTLHQELKGPYYQPLAAQDIPSDGDWHKMPLHLRGQSEVQSLKTSVTISELDGAVTMDVEITGTDFVPVALELAFRKGGELSGVTRDATEAHAETSGVAFLEDGFGRYSYENDEIEFGPGHGAHRWSQLRGAEPKLDAESVYITGFTPWRFQLKIR